jgi:HD domain
MINFDQGWEIQDPFYRNIYHRVEHYLNTRLNNVHARRSYHFALDLLSAEGGDPQLVLPTILLHDAGYSQLSENELKNAFGRRINKPELSRLHEVEGVRIAGKILQQIGYSDIYVRKILSLIDGHDTRKIPHDLNDMVFRDADKLWRYCYEGFFYICDFLDLDPQEWLDDLENLIPVLFSTRTAKIKAIEETKERRKELRLLNRDSNAPPPTGI